MTPRLVSKSFDSAILHMLVHNGLSVIAGLLKKVTYCSHLNNKVQVNKFVCDELLFSVKRESLEKHTF